MKNSALLCKTLLGLALLGFGAGSLSAQPVPPGTDPMQECANTPPPPRKKPCPDNSPPSDTEGKSTIDN